jgi:transcriptional regulator with XRE-family HTH domain
MKFIVSKMFLLVCIFTFAMNIEMENANKYQKIGGNLRKIREIKGIKQESIAKELGITTNGYGKIERGESAIKIDRLEQIASILGISALDIMQFNDSIIFNINTMSNSAPNGIVNNYALPNEERDLLLAQIKSLNEIIERQNKMIDLLMKKAK